MFGCPATVPVNRGGLSGGADSESDDKRYRLPRWWGRVVCRFVFDAWNPRQQWSLRAMNRWGVAVRVKMLSLAIDLLRRFGRMDGSSINISAQERSRPRQGGFGFTVFDEIRQSLDDSTIPRLSCSSVMGSSLKSSAENILGRPAYSKF